MKRARWLLKKYGSTALTVAALALVLLWQLSDRTAQPEQMGLADMLARSAQHQIEQAEVDSNEHRVTVTLADGTERIVSYPVEYDDELTARLLEDGVEVKAANASFWDKYGGMVFAFLPMLLILAGMFLIPKMSARVAVRKKQVNDVPAERFTDVKGATEAVGELAQLVEFLKRPERYLEAGVRIPRGWLLYGPPGTGKTLMARAVAGEAGVPFFYISGSEFAAKFVGEGAERVRALFARARTASFEQPSILFIDEIDAVGGARDDNSSGEHSVTLNQILTEMDGFLGRGSKVIVMAATNRRDSLDPALLRAGRLTRHVAMPEPDIAAREAVLRKHTSVLKHLDPGVDYTLLARITHGRSGADLAEMANAAGLIALREGAPTVTTEHFKEALATAVMGHARTSAAVGEEDRTITAVHEAGHALVAFLLPKANKPHQVTIVPRGESGGATWMLGQDRLHITVEHVLDQMAVAMAGRAAEKIRFGEGGVAALGAADDLAKATGMALRAVCEWGVASLVSRVDLDEWTTDPRAEQIAEEVDRLVQAAEHKATEQITAHRDALEKLISKLLEAETISGEDVSALVGRGDDPRALTAS